MTRRHTNQHSSRQYAGYQTRILMGVGRLNCLSPRLKRSSFILCKALQEIEGLSIVALPGPNQ